MKHPYPTTPYKYKVGESIVYTDFRYEDKECDCCGHVEQEEVVQEKRASIKSRRRTNPNSYFTMSSNPTIWKTITDPDGSKTHSPRYKTFEEQEAEKAMYNEYTLSNGKVILEHAV